MKTECDKEALVGRDLFFVEREIMLAVLQLCLVGKCVFQLGVSSVRSLRSYGDSEAVDWFES